MNPLIPKPGTAYQWMPMEDPAITDRKGKRLRQLLAGIDNVYFNIKSERHSYYQALLSLGDRRVAPAIEAAERNGGNWRAAVAETGVDGDFYIFRDRTNDAVLPWDIIDGGMKKSFFQLGAAEGRQRGMDAAAEAPEREQPLPPRSCSRARARHGLRPAAAPLRSGGDSRLRLVLLIRLQNQIANPLLRGRVFDRPQQREAAPLAVDRGTAARGT